MLTRRKATVSEERSSRKEPLGEQEARALIASVDTVVIAKGKKAVSHPAGEVKPADLKGPTGNFRAPMVRRGKTLLVGFHAASLESLL